MAPNSEQLARCLQATHQFVTIRINLDLVFGEVAKELDKIAASLKTGKLTIEIFTLFPVLAQALHDFLNLHQDIPQFYQFKRSSLLTESKLAQTNLTPALILQPNLAKRQQQNRYELSANQSILIGREHQRLEYDARSQNARLVALPMYPKVSGVHAEIKPVINKGETFLVWQICDLNSRNGTYINGERLRGCQTLHSGDKITLAYPSSSEKCPEFVFESPQNLSSNYTKTIQPVDCDIVCLVIDPKQTLSDEEKQFIENVSKNQIFRLIIIADVSGVDNQTEQQINANLAEISNWIKLTYPRLSFELKRLPLHLFKATANNRSVNFRAKQIVQEFCQPLINLAKTQSEDILLQRLNWQLTKIEQALNTQAEALTTEIQETKEKLQGQSIDNWKEQTGEMVKRLTKEIDKFLETARNELSSSQALLINANSKRSLLYKIRSKIENVNPVVAKEAGDIVIKLKPEGNKDIHEEMIEFCQVELTKWAEREWRQICNAQENGGLNGLLKRSYNSLNCIPSLTLSNLFSQPSEHINVQRSFKKSLFEINDNVSVEEEKKTAVEVYYSPDSANNIVSQAAKMGIDLVWAFLKSGPVGAAEKGFEAAPDAVELVTNTLNHSQIQKLKLQEVTAELKKNACQFYQSLVTEFMVEGVFKEIDIALEEEARRFKTTVEAINKEFDAYFTQLTNAIDRQKLRQNDLIQGKAELEQIKQLVISFNPQVYQQ